MPIRFRCSYCNRLLGIATRKAGTETKCPHCGYTITVPFPQEEDSRTERLDLGDVDAMLGKTVAATTNEVVVAAPPAVAKPQAIPKRVVETGNPDERPLFENDVDELLGKPAVLEEPAKAKPPATTGADAMDLGDAPQRIVLTGGVATLLVVLVAVLMALSFAAGYLLAPK